jgi:hypothetical protein
MGIQKNKRGVSGEVMKIAAALIIGLAVFSILLSFSFGTREGDSEIEEMGENILNFSQRTSFEIKNADD